MNNTAPSAATLTAAFNRLEALNRAHTNRQRQDLETIRDMIREEFPNGTPGIRIVRIEYKRTPTIVVKPDTARGGMFDMETKTPEAKAMMETIRATFDGLADVAVQTR